MPPTWPTKPSRKDPKFRRYGDRINFAFNVAMFATLMSGTWFFQLLYRTDWAWTPKVTLGWLGILVLHGVYVFAIAQYPGLDDPGSSQPND